MKIKKERQLFRLAEDQGGYFSLSQANELGIRRSQIYRELRRTKFERAAWGVYRFVQFPASRFEEVHVAVLSAGVNAVVGFQTALYVYELSDLIPDKIHLILPKTSSRRRPGIKVHTSQLKPGDTTHWEGFKITTVARTITDIAKTHYDTGQVELAINQALLRGLTTNEKLAEQAARLSKKSRALICAITGEVKL